MMSEECFSPPQVLIDQACKDPCCFVAKAS